MNDTVFQVDSEFRSFIVSHSLCMAETVRLTVTTQVHTTNADLPTNELAVSWCKPPSGWFKLNTDGAFERESNVATCRVVIRDDEGRWCLRFSKRIDICIVLDSEL
ncbi:hypothetical protein V6N11_052338 [Hibiscus sabdariffa]|uniref:RNase H type-1 domain-containing protein n=1 Tax=Hibiscus sabdariffa TaxID=183260 RepID=A0ABR2U9Q8_9ROSI